MSVTKWEFEQHIVHRIRGVFEAMDKEEQTAGDAFEDARCQSRHEVLAQ